ncbi:MAG: Wzz/FepE/Etk N-terminal domain-containing protein [Verrucomicrobiota bacterium]
MASVSAAAKDHASLADFLQVLRLRKALIALILALVMVTALTVTAFLPRWYLATTKVRVEKPEGEVKLFQAQSPRTATVSIPTSCRISSRSCSRRRFSIR